MANGDMTPANNDPTSYNSTSGPDQVTGSDGLEIVDYDSEGITIIGPGEFTGTELIIPSHINGNPVTIIDEDAFTEAQIVSLTVPGTVQWIREDAFEGCDKLESVTLSEGNIGIGLASFADCKALKSITIPRSVENVGRSAFHGCEGLEEVTLLGNPSLGNYAFSDCSKLKNVTFGGTQDMPYSVASEAFSGDGALESVHFSEGLSEIGSFCFENCNNLKTVYLPKTLTAVGSSAFLNMTLEKVYYAGSEADWQKIDINPSNTSLINAAIEYNYGG